MMKWIKKKIDKKGYVLIKIYPLWIHEHRIVVENYIGRLLTKDETIHHLNSHKRDNRIENLMLFKSQKEHKSFENKVKQFGFTTPIKRQINERWKEFSNCQGK